MPNRLTLQAINANVWAVHGADGQHLGNLKRIGTVWKFKAVGYNDHGAVVPGGGPLTAQHNALFDAPDEQALNARLAGHL